jgi:hypothetical protein
MTTDARYWQDLFGLDNSSRWLKIGEFGGSVFSSQCVKDFSNSKPASWLRTCSINLFWCDPLIFSRKRFLRIFWSLFVGFARHAKPADRSSIFPKKSQRGMERIFGDCTVRSGLGDLVWMIHANRLNKRHLLKWLFDFESKIHLNPRSFIRHDIFRPHQIVRSLGFSMS